MLLRIISYVIMISLGCLFLTCFFIIRGPGEPVSPACVLPCACFLPVFSPSCVLDAVACVAQNRRAKLCDRVLSQVHDELTPFEGERPCAMELEG